jgi:hypothetical protein
MSTAQITHLLESRNLRTKFVVAYYVLTIFTGAFLLFFHGSMALVVDFLVSVVYVAVTALLYLLSNSSSSGKER